jgi:hypothetical protein
MGIASSDQSMDQTTNSPEIEVLVDTNASESAELGTEDNDNTVCSAEEGGDTGEKDSAHPPGGLDSKDPPQSDPAPQTAEPADGPLLEGSRCVETQEEPATDDSSTISGMALSYTHKNNRDCCLDFPSCSATCIMLISPTDTSASQNGPGSDHSDVTTEPPRQRDDEQETPSDEANNESLIETESPEATEPNAEVSTPAPDQTKPEDVSEDVKPAEDVDAESGTLEDKAAVAGISGMHTTFHFFCGSSYTSVNSSQSANWLVAFLRLRCSPPI